MPEFFDSKPFAHRVKVITSADIVEIRDGEVVLNRYEDGFERVTVQADTVVCCFVKPDRTLYDGLKKAGVNVVNAGDAVAPRNLNAAVREGAGAGFALEDRVVLNPNGAVVTDLPFELKVMLGLSGTPHTAAELR